MSVPKIPVLHALNIFPCCSIAINSLSHLTTMSELIYKGSNSESTTMQIVPFSSWPSLSSLSLGNLTNLMPPEEQQSRIPMESLRQLDLKSCDCFLTPKFSERPLGFWEYFVFVEELEINACDGLVAWPEDELRGMNRLRSLEIAHCKNLAGSSCEEVMLPLKLEKLKIEDCPRLVMIPQLSTSLENLCIKSCNSLVELPSNLGNLAMLMMLSLSHCDGLAVLPDGMDGLGALKELEICSCPGIETLPEGLLGRLANLRRLSVSGCPELERRCRRGGEYWEYVSSIPNRHVEVAKEGSIKELTQRFLPCCRTLN